jgi:hypothetical protein
VYFSVEDHPQQQYFNSLNSFFDTFKVSAGNAFTCGLRHDGAIQCWGKNDMGQSSPPSYSEHVFQQVSTSIGGDHACGILVENNAIRCWGNNGRGQSESQDGT